ncbi:MAG: hypothetical protein N2749_06950 [Clostridia bacterium]|nr:hypothetical protein [Clostridia bacterium]
MKKGISLIALTATIAIMLILITTITISGINTADNAKKIAFATEISTVQDSVNAYVLKNDGEFPVKSLVTVNTSQITSNAITQFSGESIDNDELQLNTIDYSLIGITSLKYGALTNGDNDVYAVSEKTGRVYYIKGLKVGSDTYFTLNNELKTLVNYDINEGEDILNKGIIFVPSTTEWTNQDVVTKVKVPSSYTSTTITVNSTNIPIDTSVLDPNYTVYTVSTISGNYTINVDYNDGTSVENKNTKYTVQNVDNTVPELVIDSENQKILENTENSTITAYMNITKKSDNLSGIKTVKYENEKIDQNSINTYFKSNGKRISSDIIPIEKNTSIITVYIEDNAGNWSSEWITVNPQIYIKLLE